MNEELKIIIAADVTDLQTGVKKAEDSIKGLGESANKAKPQIANANFALTNLSRVAQDLPFGFIAIQNNLDPLLGSFQGLVTQTGSIGGALKALGSSLLGGAGLAFAFSVISSTVTSLIQNYGSLGNAIDVIFSKNKEAAAATLAYNKELEKGQGTIGAEIATIDILVKRLTDLKAPYQSRQDAYNELKKVQPDILRGMSEENALSASSIGIILGNANARKEILAIKIKEAAIGKVLDENGGKLLQAETQLNIAKKEATNLEKERLSYIDQEAKGNKAATQAISDATFALAQNKIKQEELKATVASLQKVQDSYINSLDPLVAKVAEINNQTQKAVQSNKAEADAKKTQTKANDDLAASIDKVTKAEKAKQAKQTAERTQQALIPNFGVEQNKPINPLATAGEVNPFVGNPIKESLLQEAAAAAAARTEYQKYAETVSGLVAPAIDELFSAIQNGQNVFEALGQSVKALIIDIVKAIAKTLILNAITTAIGGGAGAGIFGGLFKALGGSLGGVASPQFTGGAGLSGGMALSGQVVFVQRGTDLVGVLNRGNSQINRVG